MFRLLGAPKEHKRHVIYPSRAQYPAKRNDQGIAGLAGSLPGAGAVGAVLLGVWNSWEFETLAVGAQVNPSAPTIFDLSPSEKLQLIEDLWDDLAATPESVPVHDWQKQELSRRKTNLANNPASALAWEEVKRRVRARHGL